MLTKFKELGKESLIYGISGMLNKFIAVFLVPVYTNIFTQEQFGVQGLIVTVIMLASALAIMGLDSATHTWYWKTENEDDRRITISSWFWWHFATASLIGLAIAVYAVPLSILIVGDETAGPLLLVSSTILPLNVCHGVVTNYLRLRRMANAMMIYTFFSSLALIGLTVLFIIVLNYGLIGFFIAQVANGVLTTGVGIWILRKFIAPRWARFSRLKEMMRFALPLVPATFAFWALGFADRLFIEKIASTEQVAIFQFASTLASAVGMITGAFCTAWGPFALSLQREPNAAAFCASVLPLYLAGGGIVVAGLTLFAREVTQVLTPANYISAGPVAGILALGVLLNGLSNVACTGLALASKSAPISIAVFIAAGVNLLLNFLLIPPFGITGAAWAASLAWLIYTVYLFYCSQKIYPFPYKFWRSTVILLMVTLVVICSSYLPELALLPTMLLKISFIVVFSAIVVLMALPDRFRIIRNRIITS